jgi:hypothetical protein
LVNGQLTLIEVVERDEPYVKGPDGVLRPQREHDRIEFFAPLSLGDRWHTAPKKDYQPPPSKRLFRPGEADSESPIRIPRIDVEPKKN